VNGALELSGEKSDNMNISKKIIRNSILVGIVGGILNCLVVFSLSALGSQKVHWSKLPSPPEETVAILQLYSWGGALQAKSGHVYACAESKPACTLVELTQDEIVSLAECEHINQNDEDFSEPPSQSDRVIDACKMIDRREEGAYTLILLLYEDSSLWLSESGGPTLPMYGATYLFIIIFCAGGLVSFVLSLGIFLARAEPNEDPR
jgi:hypothetical protein